MMVMYRNSTALHSFTYTVHVEIVRILEYFICIGNCLYNYLIVSDKEILVFETCKKRHENSASFIVVDYSGLWQKERRAQRNKGMLIMQNHLRTLLFAVDK